MDKIINCKEIRERRLAKLAELLPDGHDCCVAFIHIGESAASEVYVRNKITWCERFNIKVLHYRFYQPLTETQLLELISSLNENPYVHGIMVQLPLPRGIDEAKIINAISPEKDIDGFHPLNKGKVMSGDYTGIIPATPKGIMELLSELKVDLRGLDVVIVGRSNIVGKPLAQLMINAGATVTVCNSRTLRGVLVDHINNCDIFVSAIGQPNYFSESFFEDEDRYLHLDNVIAIDVGINRDENDKLCGDIDRNIHNEFKAVTTVPGGVGLLTVMALMENIVQCYLNRRG